MSDPRRLLDLAEDDDLTDLLREPLDLDPPADAKARVYAGVIATLGPPGGGGPTGGEGAGGGSAAGPATGGAAATGGASAAGFGASAQVGALSVVSAAKWAFFGGMGAAIVLGASVALEPSAPPAAQPPPSTLVASPTATAHADPRPAPHANETAAPAVIGPETTPSARPSSVGFAVGSRAPVAASTEITVASAEPVAPPLLAPSASSSASRLLEENRLLGDARASLQGGDAAGALRTIETSRAQFPRAVLAQERDALEVEALSASGRHGDARARATTFLSRYPTSPHAQRMGELAR